MSSVAGLTGFPGLSPYTASKHTVCGLVRTISLELGEAGMRAAVEQMIPMKRYGTSDEVASVALFLASDDSKYCTGTLLLC